MNGNRERYSKISLYVDRSVGDTINIAIDFLRQNWRTALRLSIYLLMPIALLHSVGIFTWVRSISSDYYNSSDIGFLSTIFFQLIGLCATYALILTLVLYYQGSVDGDLSMLTFRYVKGVIWSNFKRVLLCMLIILFFMALLTGVCIVLFFIPLGAPAAILIYVIMFFIMMMIPIYYVLEDVSLGQAIGRSFSHAKNSWGRLFGLMFALMMVVGIILSATSLPMTVFIFTSDSLLPSGELGTTADTIFDIIIYAFIVIETFFAYLCMALVVTVLVFHYGRVSSSHDDLALGSDIDNFANL